MLKMPICRYEESKVKYRTKILWMSRNVKYCRCQYIQTRKTKKIYIELKYCRCQYAQNMKAK